MRIAARITSVLLSTAWRKGTNTHFCPFLGPFPLTSMIVRLADFVLIYIQIRISICSAEIWPEHPRTQILTLKIGSLKGENCFHAWKSMNWRFRGFQKWKKRYVTLDIHHQATFNSDSVCSNTNSIHSIFISTTAWSFLFMKRKKKKNKDYQGPKMIFYCSSSMANDLQMFDRDSMLTDNELGGLLIVGWFSQPLEKLLLVKIVPFYIGLDNFQRSSECRPCSSTAHLNEIFQLGRRKQSKK